MRRTLELARTREEAPARPPPFRRPRLGGLLARFFITSNLFLKRPFDPRTDQEEPDDRGVTMGTNGSRKRRPHPARRARKLAGCAQHHQPARPDRLHGCDGQDADRIGSDGPDATPTTSVDRRRSVYTSDDDSTSSRSTPAAAVAAAAATQSNTSTHAS